MTVMVKTNEKAYLVVARILSSIRAISLVRFCIGWAGHGGPAAPDSATASVLITRFANDLCHTQIQMALPRVVVPRYP